MIVTPRLSGTVSNATLPLEAYVAATCSSTLSLNPLTDAHVDWSLREREPAAALAEICGRSLMNTGVRSTTWPPPGLVETIGRLNSTLSV